MKTHFTASPTSSNRRLQLGIAFLGFVCIFAIQSTAQQAQVSGPTPVIVQSKFGGQIFGFDIDQNGTEGVLTEAQTFSSGKVLAAVETFDQQTGKILSVLAETQS